jgi:hypothetical protein
LNFCPEIRNKPNCCVAAWALSHESRGAFFRAPKQNGWKFHLVPADFQFRDPIAGWWVAGNLASPVEIDALAATNATATYNGSVLASVINGPRTYDATGNLSMGWKLWSQH